MMFHLVFLLGSMAITTTTETDIRNRKVVISTTGTLVSLNDPSIDIDLSGRGLRSIDSNAFANSTHIRSLNLSNNSIERLPERVFSHLTNLEHLSLANNQLGGLATKNAFLGLDQLKSLNISFNPLKKILDQKNFVGLSKSCDIFIKGSKKFSVISPLAFGGKTVPSTLAKIEDQTRPNLGNICNNTRFNTDIRQLLARREPAIDSNVRIKICIEDFKLKFVDLSNTDEALTPNCMKGVPEVNSPKLEFPDMRIASYEKGWYRLKNMPFNSIYLVHNRIGDVTSDLLNDLPEEIKYVSLERNDIERLNKGVIVNEHLRGLDLSHNGLSAIEEDAFIGTNLTQLNLGSNSLKHMRFTLGLPTSLIRLNLESNEINEISAGSFSHLKELRHIQFCYNSISELHPQSFSGLKSLQYLDLSFVELKKLQPGVFQDLGNLTNLDLYANEISNLEKGVFNGLECLTSLDLGSNKLTRFTKDMLNGLTENCDEIFLNSNELGCLEPGSFVNIPKSELSLAFNKISQIKEGAFDLPYLKTLELQFNNITVIESGAAKNLGNLAGEIHVKLSSNPIKRLDNGALSGLPSKAHVDLSRTPIEVIQAGLFDVQFRGCDPNTFVCI